MTIRDVLISDDLLRFEFKEEDWWGWIYAYLRAPTVRGMMKAAEYGHIIKHLETHHLDSLPIVCVDGQRRAQFGARAREVLELRDRAYKLTLEAERLFEKAFGAFEQEDTGEVGFSFRAHEVFSGRRRLDRVALQSLREWFRGPSGEAS